MTEKVIEMEEVTFKFNLPGTKIGSFNIIGLWGTSYIGLGREIDDTSPKCI